MRYTPPGGPLDALLSLVDGARVPTSEWVGALGFLVALLLVATPTARHALDRLPMGVMVAPHALRLLGGGWLATHGEGPAWAAGAAELTVSLAAGGVGLGTRLHRVGRRGVAAWNTVGSVSWGVLAWALVQTPEVPWWLLLHSELTLVGHLALTRRVATESLLLGPWLSLASMVEAAITVTWRRWRRGPQRPSWSWLYEATVTWLRDRFTVLAFSSPRLVRRHVDVVGGLGSPAATVTWRWTEILGRAARWAVPVVDRGGVVLFLHGGGYVFGSIRSHPGLIGALATITERRVLAVEYRLAPECPCPAALDDALAAWDGLIAEGWAPDDIVVFGDSAGGGLALALLVQLRDRGGPQPSGAVLLSPWVDLAVTGDSVERWTGVDYLGTPEVLRRYASLYLGDLPVTDVRASPLYADLTGLPPLLVVVGACEMLLDDAVRLTDKARAAGVEVTLHVEPDEVHVYPVLSSFTPRGRDGIARIGAWVIARRGLSEPV